MVRVEGEVARGRREGGTWREGFSHITRWHPARCCEIFKQFPFVLHIDAWLLSKDLPTYIEGIFFTMRYYRHPRICGEKWRQQQVIGTWRVK
jgi:hypothetical protein